MTDNEIIKALECCNKCNTTGSIDECCPECPLSDYDGCCDKLIVELAGLFNRQKAEIERLETMHSEMCIGMEKLKEKAITKFAERLRRKIGYYEPTNASVRGHINNLVKEMTTQPIKVEHNSLCETESYKGGAE